MKLKHWEKREKRLRESDFDPNDEKLFNVLSSYTSAIKKQQEIIYHWL